MFMPRANSFRQFEAAADRAFRRAIAPAMPETGMLAATLVETADGWRAAGTLARGDRVQTRDGGLAEITRVTRSRLWPAGGADLVRVPGGALDNCADLWLAAGQRVMVASRIAEEVLDAAGVLVAARDLVGFRGTELCRLNHPTALIGLGFAGQELVFVNSGTLVLGAAEGGAGDLDAQLPSLEGARVRAMLKLIDGQGVAAFHRAA